MDGDKIYEDLSLILRRARTVFIVIEALFIILVLYYWKIQILEHDKYWKLSEANRTRDIILPSPRGIIRDRNGLILADNTASFRACIIRENSKNFEESCRNISRLLEMDEEVLKKRIQKYASLPLFAPLVVKDSLTIEEVSRIEGRKLEFAELIIESEPKRSYPLGTSASHVLGYLQEISPQELKMESFKKKHLGDLVGKTGIEKEYEGRLQGTPGKLIEIVDSLGRSRGEIGRIAPVQGENILLTLDYDLQKKAEELLSGREGAIIALDPRNGEVLALASFPTFDPNKFVSRFSPDEWQSIISSPVFPLENRAIRGLYSPGSVFKPLMALGGLELNVISESTSFYCSGRTEIYGHPFSCWFKPGHGAMNLTNGIKNSCNIYFYNVGKRMGIEAIARTAEMMGLGKKCGIDIPGEKEGLVPSPEWKQKSYHTVWFPGETISVAIGQGPLVVTPLQVASYTARIANRGTRIVPHLFKSSENAPPAGERGPFSLDSAAPIKRETFDKVIEGMWMSVNEGGTGRGARVEGFNVCGKTGSTQTMSSERAERLSKQGREVKTHSWFTGFASKGDPKIVITVLVEYGGMGGVTAAPLARELFDLFKKKYD